MIQALKKKEFVKAKYKTLDWKIKLHWRRFKLFLHFKFATPIIFQLLSFPYSKTFFLLHIRKNFFLVNRIKIFDTVNSNYSKVFDFFEVLLMSGNLRPDFTVNVGRSGQVRTFFTLKIRAFVLPPFIVNHWFFCIFYVNLAWLCYAVSILEEK